MVREVLFRIPYVFKNFLTFFFTALNLNKLLPHPFYVLTILDRFSNSETAYKTLTWVKLVSSLVWQRTHLVFLQELQILFRISRVTADDRDVCEYRRHECYERAEPEHGWRYEERFHARFQTENNTRISKLCRKLSILMNVFRCNWNTTLYSLYVLLSSHCSH